MSRINVGVAKYGILFFGCVVFHIAGTWSLPLIDRDEPRFAEASREMIERQDYVVPYFNNHPRLDKPPLTYWAQMASYHIFGENDFAARFPSAIAAALTALSIFAWGSQIAGTRLGWSAAIIFTLSLQTFVHAKAAVADMWLVLFMTLAYWSGYELLNGSSSSAARPAVAPYQFSAFQRFRWLIFYLSLAVGFLAKGPVAWAPLVVVGSVMFFAPDLELARHFKFARGILLMLVIVALWGVPTLIRTHGEFLSVGIGRNVVGRSVATMEGHGANSLGMYFLLLPFYFVTVFASFFPWSVKIPTLTTSLWRGRDKIDNYLLAGVAIIFVIFTFVATKLPHYTLPAFPLLALLLARRLTAENATRFFRNCAVASVALYLAIALAVPSIVARFFPAYQLFQVSRTALQPNMDFAAVQFEEPSLVWYFRSRVKGFLKPLNKRRAAEFMSASGPRFVILPMPVAGMLFPDAPQSWKFVTVSGFNIAKGERVDLTLVLKPE